MTEFLPTKLSPREYVEFVRERDVAWKAFDAAGTPSGRDVKYLATGTENDAFSGLVRYPAGYAAPEGAHAEQIELYILEGSVTIGGTTCGPHTYVFVPEGVAYGPVEATEDSVVLTHHEGSADLVPATGAGEVTITDTTQMEWVWGKGEGLPQGLTHKTVRHNAETGERTFVLGVIPWWDSPKIEFHPCVEEAYVIQGDMYMGHVGDLGTMGPGDYFWRPAWISHGPFYVGAGSVCLVRHDSPHKNYFAPNTEATAEENKAQVEQMLAG